ncbi:hypothetical protein [Cellulomonas shaoxiangyii]|uniref:DUF8129 domain-containing protein n=1 Tax=Cellulomonas shaoxiangyii TaxID=2566013 RepID=A0A4P7SHR1_9CELL|nr:hypothetical protein [Cellulomonas shaoxiangyii]QCB93067.1 hypothetical protein E5225_05365 [Cellulomonas shaoxiangyii]TGY82998.1 hypothetical protein E5226_12690 [Cellulomonas shaoxiangyii]
MTDDVPRDALPVPDHVDLPVGSLGHRIRSLEADDLDQLRRYEQAHGNRLPVLQVLEQRLGELADGAEPSTADPAGDALAPPPRGGSAVSPVTTGPPQSPPSHGDPTNPSQPRG